MEYLNIYANCQLVKGANMSLLCDLQMRRFYHLPNDTAEVLLFLQQYSIDECIAHYGEDNREAITGYVDFFVSRELGFIDDHILPELTAMELTWDRFADITNVVIEYQETIDYTGPFFRELLDQHLEGLEIRFYQPVALPELRELLALFSDSTLRHIKLVLPYEKSLNIATLDELVKKNQRVKSLLLHSSPEEKLEKIFSNSVPVYYFTGEINSCMACGEIRANHFTVNTELFTESLRFNSCLNRKLSIDQQGYIKNCPSMRENYGHVADTSLQAVLDNKTFNRYSHIRKDDIAVCKDCEFRHVCTDCRAYIENPQDIYSKPLKCGYNPYTNNWEEWAQHPMKQAAIEWYGMAEIIK
ncbi:grasp-with-spasm system SPASM domain peptide maturase [Chitinophaga sp. 22536]|uniref:grasp-with-spasm system SPASM domain peptide maturase n=1 Tax=unclassified Chitinophaga TaxID=2619133 RepID=UPI003F86B01D